MLHTGNPPRSVSLHRVMSSITEKFTMTIFFQQTVMMAMTIFFEQSLSSTCDLVHVQDQPWQVADDEDGDDQHQDDRHVVIFSTSTSHSPP